MERLLKEYRQNQELVRRIGGHYYQIIYPVQLRHHEKMGISTREVSPPKVRTRKRLRYLEMRKRRKRNIRTLNNLTGTVGAFNILQPTFIHTSIHTYLRTYQSFIQTLYTYMQTYYRFEILLIL